MGVATQCNFLGGQLHRVTGITKCCMSCRVAESEYWNLEFPLQVWLLSADLVQLKWMDYFSKAFFACNEQESAELTCTISPFMLSIHLGSFVVFQISSGFLIETYVNVPSCVSEEQSDDAADSVGSSALVFIYLVEPWWASSAILKFSGTLGMPHCSDRQSATIMAFSHFVLENTTCRYMFADIQGKSLFNCMSFHSLVHKCRINGLTQFCAEWVCLDTLWSYDSYTSWVSHLDVAFTSDFVCNIYSNSSLSDHGTRGFEDFIATHTCTGICTAMNLCLMSDLQAAMLNLQDLGAESSSDMEDN